MPPTPTPTRPHTHLISSVVACSDTASLAMPDSLKALISGTRPTVETMTLFLEGRAGGRRGGSGQARQHLAGVSHEQVEWCGTGSRSHKPADMQQPAGSQAAGSRQQAAGSRQADVHPLA